VSARSVTLKDVRDAALIGQIVGEASMADAPTICLGEGCGHPLEEDCVASALGASGGAYDLWLCASNAIATTRNERAAEIADAETSDAKLRLKKLYAWVDGVCGSIEDLATAELHAASLLRDGDIPPGWSIEFSPAVEDQ